MDFKRLKTIYTEKKYHVLPIKSGMYLELHENVGEGDTKRIQKFKGLVIQVKKPSHPDGTFTIRGTVAGVTVEKIFPLSFENFEKVLLLDQFKTRRARINYIRTKVGKNAKMKSIIAPEDKEKDLLAEAKKQVGLSSEGLSQESSSPRQYSTPNNNEKDNAVGTDTTEVNKGKNIDHDE